MDQYDIWHYCFERNTGLPPGTFNQPRRITTDKVVVAVVVILGLIAVFFIKG